MSKKVLLLITALFAVLVLLFLARVLPPDTKVEPEPPEVTRFTPTLSPTPPPSQGVGIETEEYKQAEREYIAKTPILQKLPAKSSFFFIEYIDEQHLVVRSKTSNPEQDYQVARQWFEENDIDISKVVVEYK